MAPGSPMPEVTEEIASTPAAALAIDNPRYSGYLQACERWVGP